jgi:sRNA-binding regulator protein Hfq
MTAHYLVLLPVNQYENFHGLVLSENKTSMVYKTLIAEGTDKQ